MIMGGFHYFTSSDKAKGSYKAEYPLEWQEVITLLENKTIDLPTEEEIRDKSKSDWVAKTIVLLQTLWFVTQCIARYIQHLPTTQLEIVTLAYTIINLGIFFAWWDKPRNVECPIRVFHRSTKPEDDVVHVPWWIRIPAAMLFIQDIWVSLRRERKVPLLYSGNPTVMQVLVADGLALAAAIVFGAIHCAAWSFEFATPLQAILWRGSSIVITTIPVLGSSAVFLGFLESRCPRWWVPWVIAAIIVLPTPFSVLLYFTARLIAVVISFINLSSLPHGAFQTVHWTTLIPHL
jgi:hypothetical protein